MWLRTEVGWGVMTEQMRGEGGPGLLSWRDERLALYLGP